MKSKQHQPKHENNKNFKYFIHLYFLSYYLDGAPGR